MKMEIALRIVVRREMHFSLEAKDRKGIPKRHKTRIKGKCHYSHNSRIAKAIRGKKPYPSKNESKEGPPKCCTHN